MTTTDEQYTPDDFRRDLRRVHGYASLRIVRDAGDDAVRKFDEILARVRRDAAREALDGLRSKELAMIPADAEEDHPVRIQKYALAWRIDMLIRSDYPEETP